MRTVLATIVVGVDGSTTVGGSSAGLSTSGDRQRFQRLRKRADLIVIGGNTARTEPYAQTPCRLLVLSHQPLPEKIADNPHAEFASISIRQAVESNTGTILIEAGPQLLGEALRARLVDELHLTIVHRSGENQISISELISGYAEISREHGEDGEEFVILRPA